MSSAKTKNEPDSSFTAGKKCKGAVEISSSLLGIAGRKLLYVLCCFDRGHFEAVSLQYFGCLRPLNMRYKTARE
jgi:hypothetical protein